jgi:protein O-mannosyl-transferase
MSRPRLVALLLTLATLLVFMPVGRFGFVNFDDDVYVTANPFVSHGLTLAGIKWAFTSFYADNWHPITWLSHMADCQLFHLNAGAHHLVNVLLHSVNTALLFILIWRLTQKLGPSAFVAALFAWHPLHVESVAWIAERKDVLSAFFALLTMLSYAEFVKNSSRCGFWLALIFFTLGLMSKPMLVTLPFVLLLLDYWPLRRFSLDSFRYALVMEKIPFFALSAVSCVVTVLAQKAGKAIVPFDKIFLDFRLENAVVGVLRYLQKFFWPSDLCVIYLLPKEIHAPEILLAVAVLILVSATAWLWRHTRPYFLVGWLWFLGTLVPVSGLVQVGNQAIADRYTYIPSIGFFIALVFLADEVAIRLNTPRIIRFGFAGLICCACVQVTEHQLQFWRNGEALFRRAVAVNPHNDVALIDLGVALDAEGRFEEAVNVYRQAEQAGSRRVEVHNNLGNVLGILGRHAESLAEYSQAIHLESTNADAHAAVGRQLAAIGRYNEALRELLTSEKLNPNSTAAHVETAKVLFKLGRDAEGLAEFRAALRLQPNNFEILATTAHYLAANENAAARDGKTAIALALKANDFSGHVQPMVFDILGMAFAENGDFTDAVTCAQHALDLAHDLHMSDAESLQRRLDLYKEKQPWRESFRAVGAPAKNK